MIQVVTLNKKEPTMKKPLIIIWALLALLVFVAFPSSARADQCDDVTFDLYYGIGNNLYEELDTATAGATIFFTVSSSGYPADPTHNGGTPGSGTIHYYGRVPIPYGQTYYFAAVAYKAGYDD